MHNPTSACPGLPDAARGTSPRSTNCPEHGLPYPQNGSCWTRRIVSAVDRFEADSFPKKEKLGGGTNRRSSPRPQGLSPRRETFAQPPFPHLHPHRHSRESGNPGWTWRGGAPSLKPCAIATPQPSPHMAVAPATRRASDPSRSDPRKATPTLPGGSPANEQSTRKAMPKLPGVSTKQTINPLCTFQVQKAQKKGQTIHRTITIRQPAAGGDPLRRRRTGATPCSAVRYNAPSHTHETPAAPGALWRPLHNHHSRTHPPSSPHPHTATPQPSPAWPSRQRPGIQGGGAARGTPLTPSPHKAVAQRPPATGSVT